MIIATYYHVKTLVYFLCRQNLNSKSLIRVQKALIVKLTRILKIKKIKKSTLSAKQSNYFLFYFYNSIITTIGRGDWNPNSSNKGEHYNNNLSTIGLGDWNPNPNPN